MKETSYRLRFNCFIYYNIIFLIFFFWQVVKHMNGEACGVKAHYSFSYSLEDVSRQGRDMVVAEDISFGRMQSKSYCSLGKCIGCHDPSCTGTCVTNSFACIPAPTSTVDVCIDTLGDYEPLQQAVDSPATGKFRRSAFSRLSSHLHPILLIDFSDGSLIY